MKLEFWPVTLMLIYVVVTYVLSVIGMRRARSLQGFAIGNKDMGPVVVGITMAASIASTATFVINPGFVYTHGLAALIHFGPASLCGIAAAFLLMTRRFRVKGERALTIPHWIHQRFNSRALSTFYALINLLSLSFVVLILAGCGYICAQLFGVSYHLALAGILLFTFSYVLMGGAYAHAYTNVVQGVLMTVIALFLFADGLPLLLQDGWAKLDALGPHYLSWVNPQSNLYFDAFAVAGSAFIITFALMMQPHILSKLLYLRHERDTRVFLVTTLAVAACFSLMLWLGLFAHLVELPQDISQDKIVTAYLHARFGGSGFLLALISVSLLAAGMSTLDGILVALSAMVVNDLVLPFSDSAETGLRRGLALSRWVLVAIGLVAFALAWDPPKLVGLFAQKGVYGLVAASVVPLLFGTLSTRPLAPRPFALAALVGLVAHFALNRFPAFANPSVSASLAIAASAATAWFGLKFWPENPASPAHVPSTQP